MLKQTVSVMVRDYREGSKTVKGGGFRIESVAKHANVKKSFKSVVNQLKMSGSVGSQSLQKQPGSKPTNDSGSSMAGSAAGKKKKIQYKYIQDESSSSDCFSEESSEFSEDESSSPPKSGSNLNASTSSGGLLSEEYEEDVFSEEEYTVEKIVDMKQDKNGKKFFFIKWMNYPSSENTWEPLENLEKCRDIVNQFVKTNSKQTKSSTSKVSNKRRTSLAQLNDNKRHKSEETKEKKQSITENGLLLNENVNDAKNNEPPVIQHTATVDSVPTSNENAAAVSGVTGETYIAIPQCGEIFYFRVIDDEQINWIYVDLTESESKEDTIYKCIITEDLTDKEPKLILGATRALNGETYCIVQFEGYTYAEVIHPNTLFVKFPSFRRYFELHCPHLFVKNSH